MDAVTEYIFIRVGGHAVATLAALLVDGGSFG